MRHNQNPKDMQARARLKYVAAGRGGLVQAKPKTQQKERQDRVALRIREQQTRDRLRLLSRRKDEKKKQTQRLNEAEQKKLHTSILNEKHPDRLREKLGIARTNGMDMAAFHDKEDSLKKMDRARQSIADDIKHLTHLHTSATTKEAMANIQSGHSERAVRDLGQVGRDGGVFNELSNTSLKLSRHATELAKESGKHFDSLMQQTLKEHSMPTDSMMTQKAADKSDQNLEGVKQQDSTIRQMWTEHIRQKRGAGYGG